MNKKRTGKRIAAWFMCLVMALTTVNLPMFTNEAKAAAGDKITYVDVKLDDDGKIATVSKELEEDATTLTSDMTTLGEEGATTWYIAKGEVKVENIVSTLGDVHIILADACNYSIYKLVISGSLTIYGQEEQTGKLTIPPNPSYHQSVEGGSFVINGGQLDINQNWNPRVTPVVETELLIINNGSMKVSNENGTNLLGSKTILNGGLLEIINNRNEEAPEALLKNDVIFSGGKLKISNAEGVEVNRSAISGTITIAEGWNYKFYSGMNETDAKYVANYVGEKPYLIAEPCLEHDFVYAPMGIKTHKKSCAICPYSVVENHLNDSDKADCPHCRSYVGAGYVDVQLDDSGKISTVSKNFEFESTYLNSNMTTLGEEGATTWYIAKGEVKVENIVSTLGDVHIILADACNYSIYKLVISGSLTIYGQEEQTGKLTIPPNPSYHQSVEGGSFVINGGQLDINQNWNPRVTPVVETELLIINNGSMKVSNENGRNLLGSKTVLNGGLLEIINNRNEEASEALLKNDVIFSGGKLKISNAEGVEVNRSAISGTITIAEGWNYKFYSGSDEKNALYKDNYEGKNPYLVAEPCLTHEWSISSTDSAMHQCSFCYKKESHENIELTSKDGHKCLVCGATENHKFGDNCTCVCGVIKHNFDDEGVCTVCEYECTHENQNGSTFTDGVCSICSYNCVAKEHVKNTNNWSNKNATEHECTCSVCGSVMKGTHHFSADGKCIECGIVSVKLSDDIDISVEKVKYDEASHTPVVTVSYKGTELIVGSDYTITVDSRMEVGKYELVITGINQYCDSVTVPWSIIPNEGLWYDELPAMQYTGKALKPALTVYYGDEVLRPGKDYTLSYKNNTNATTAGMPATITVKGKGNFAGSTTANFEIKKVDITDLVLPDDLQMVYTGKVMKPSVNITYFGKALKIGKEYEIRVNNNEEVKAAKTYDVVIAGLGNFTGEINTTLTVADVKSADKFVVSKIAKQNYNEGKAIEPEFTVKYGKDTLTKGNDYEVTYKNNSKVGIATIVITGKNDYVGTKLVNFEIVGTAISKAKVTGLDDMEYTGKAITLSNLKLMVGDKTLTSGTDYTVSYDNNVLVGKGNVTITGKNGYVGTVKKTFKINPYAVQANDTKITASALDMPLVKGGSKSVVTVTFDGKQLVEGVDFTVSYKNNKAVTTEAIATIKFKGNLSGTMDCKYSITAADPGATISISGAKATVAAVEYDGTAKTPKLSGITIGKEKTPLTEGVDYKIIGYAKNVNKGTATVTIQGIGKYYGTKVVSFKIGTTKFEWWSKLIGLFS